MQNLIPGITWGKTMSKKQFEEHYQRMTHREKKKEEELQKQRENKKDEDLNNCTFKPVLMAKPFKQSKSPKSSLKLIKHKIKGKCFIQVI
jgi:hypothetical protein